MSRPKVVKATRSEKRLYSGKNPLYGKLIVGDKELDVEAISGGGCIRLRVKAPDGFYFSDEKSKPYTCTGIEEVYRRVDKLVKCGDILREKGDKKK